MLARNRQGKKIENAERTLINALEPMEDELLRLNLPSVDVNLK